jgi:hypothetical protein
MLLTSSCIRTGERARAQGPLQTPGRFGARRFYGKNELERGLVTHHDGVHQAHEAHWMRLLVEKGSLPAIYKKGRALVLKTNVQMLKVCEHMFMCGHAHIHE